MEPAPQEVADHAALEALLTLLGPSYLTAAAALRAAPAATTDSDDARLRRNRARFCTIFKLSIGEEGRGD